MDFLKSLLGFLSYLKSLEEIKKQLAPLLRHQNFKNPQISKKKLSIFFKVYYVFYLM